MATLLATPIADVFEFALLFSASHVGNRGSNPLGTTI